MIRHWHKLFFITILSIFTLFHLSPSFAKEEATDKQALKRTIKFVNLCPFPVWFGTAGGSAENRHPSHPGDTRCNSNADCYTGTTCTQTGDLKQCFWNNPVPKDGQFRLAANGGTNSVDLPISSENFNILWSGAAAGRTNCTAAGCETADCGSPNACLPSRGFEQPTTQAEFTFVKRGKDFYNLTVINGFNMPVEMGPNLTKMKECTGKGCDAPYECGNPGATEPLTQLGRCSWDFVPPSSDYKWVAKGGAACSSNANCGSSQVCGLSFDPTRSPMFQKTCGKFLGYWTANEVCGRDRNFAPFNCNKKLPAPQNNLTMWNLYACAAIGSCYQNGADKTCCGCIDWDKIGIDVPPSPITQQCKNSNLTWTSGVQPTLTWFKKGCPTTYTYPYDDMSSTFTCSKDVNGINQQNYVITYCPGGKTGGITG